MAFELLPANFIGGLEANAAKSQTTLKYLATLTPPITEAVMRAGMEVDQIDPYSDEGWLDLMGQLSNIAINESVLDPTELGVINVIRQIVTPDPSLDCCGFTPVVSALTSIAIDPFVGSITWQHKITVKLDPSTSCDIKSIDVTLTGVPATIPPTFKCTFDKCVPSGRLFTYLWTTYASDPTGVGYAINYDFKDTNDISITSFVPSYSPVAFP